MIPLLGQNDLFMLSCMSNPSRRSVQGGVNIPPFSLLSIGLSLNQERTYSWPGPVLGIRIRYKTGGEADITCRHHRSKNFSFQQCQCPDNIISNLAICIRPSPCSGSVPLWYPKSPTLPPAASSLSQWKTENLVRFSELLLVIHHLDT